MWSQALGLGLSALGALGASKTAKADMVMRQRELEAMKQQQGFMQFMGMNAWDMANEENDYVRQLEALNRQLMGQERQFQIDQMMEYGGVLSEERQFQIDRQIEMDREAARQSQFQLEQYLRNQQITEQERKFAEDQLKQVQAIAKGEREDDLRRFYEEKAKAEEERDFVLKQFYAAEQDTRTQQARDLALRDRITGQVDQMQLALRRAATELGAMPEAPKMTKEDLDREIARRTELANANVDRAATRVASINEANLIREGIDSATPGTARRADITREISDQYANAQAQAYDEALRYITGQQDVAMRGYDAEVGRRNNILSEILGVESAGINDLRSLPGVTSLQGLAELANGLKSGVYTRGISSANNYNAGPLGSAVYNGTMPGSRLSSYDVNRSAANNTWGQVGSGILGPYNQNIPDASSFLSGAATIGQNMFSAANQKAQNSADDASKAWGNFGGHLQDFVEWYGSRPTFDSDLTSSQRPPRRPA